MTTKFDNVHKDRLFPKLVQLFSSHHKICKPTKTQSLKFSRIEFLLNIEKNENVIKYNYHLIIISIIRNYFRIKSDFIFMHLINFCFLECNLIFAINFLIKFLFVGARDVCKLCGNQCTSIPLSSSVLIFFYF